MLCFKAQWSVDYTTTELDGRALCLLFSDIIAILKEYKGTLTLPDYTYHDIFNSQEQWSEKLEN